MEKPSEAFSRSLQMSLGLLHANHHASDIWTMYQALLAGDCYVKQPDYINESDIHLSLDGGALRVGLPDAPRPNGNSMYRIVVVADRRVGTMVHTESPIYVHSSDWVERATDPMLFAADPVEYGVNCSRCNEYYEHAERVEGFTCYPCRS